MCEKSVGLVLLTEVPDLGISAVLRERGFYNFEETKFESWPGACQVTVHGKLGPNETFMQALRCETEEELGSRFLNAFWPVHHNNMVEVVHLLTDKKEVLIYAAKIDFCLLNLIRLCPDSGSIRFLLRHELGSVRDIRDYTKEDGAWNRALVAMFPDEKEAVKRAFELFSKPEAKDLPKSEKEKKL